MKSRERQMQRKSKSELRRVRSMNTLGWQMMRSPAAMSNVRSLSVTVALPRMQSSMRNMSMRTAPDCGRLFRFSMKAMRSSQ